jgi:hypothetical protein
VIMVVPSKSVAYIHTAVHMIAAVVEVDNIVVIVVEVVLIMMLLVAVSHMADDTVVNHGIEVVVVAVAMKVVVVVEMNKNALAKTNYSFVGKCLASVDQHWILLIG